MSIRKTRPLVGQPFFIAHIPFPPRPNPAKFLDHRFDAFVELIPEHIFERDLRQAIDFWKTSFNLLRQATHYDISLVNAIHRSPEKVPLSVTLRFFLSNLWNEGLDDPTENAIKIVCDYLKLDRRTIVEMHAEKRQQATSERIEIEISCLKVPK